MDSVLIESPMAQKSPNVDLIFNPSYNSVLKESIDRFLTSIQTKTLDFSSFHSIFSRLLQSSPNPPLEIIWFFSAVSNHETLTSAKTYLNRATAIKALIQFLETCSSSCSGLKSIALLAPSISELYSCVLEEKKFTGKIEGLIEGILSYISICSAKSCDFEDSATGLLPCFLDLVKVWNVGRGLSGNGGGLDLFLPLVSQEIRREFEGDGSTVEFLAGVVIVEAFLLSLWLKVQRGRSSKEELRVWAVSSVTVFRNHVFFEVLLRLLLEPTLPTISLSDSKDENLLREILYDVVILVDYSFLNPETNVEQSYDFMRRLAVRRLIVTHDAIRIAREKRDYEKAISYTSAFSSSSLPNQIIKWVADQTSIERTKWPDVKTPQVLLRWLLGFEDQGLRFFEDDIAKLLRTRLMLEESKAAPKGSIFKAEKKEAEADLFYIDNKPHVEEEGDDMQPLDDAAFLAAARSMNSPASNMRKKRKEAGDKKETRVKFIKYKVHESSTKDYNSGSEVDNPSSDDEMEEN